MLVFIGLLLFITTFLEGTVTSLPLVFVCLLSFSLVNRSRVIYLFAFMSGIVLDILTLNPVGVSSIFFLIVLFLVQLYHRKYEIYSYPFLAVASFIGSLLYLGLFGHPQGFIQAVVSVFFAVVLFSILRINLPVMKMTLPKK